jgi:alpha-beta hydrolase superfamily lysophospholipase
MQGTTISHDGTPIAFEAEGSGPPLVLLHGFAGEGRDWHEKGYVSRLTALGRRVITLDARGHGKSGKPHHASDYADYKRAAVRRRRAAPRRSPAARRPNHPCRCARTQRQQALAMSEPDMDFPNPERFELRGRPWTAIRI